MEQKNFIHFVGNWLGRIFGIFLKKDFSIFRADPTSNLQHKFTKNILEDFVFIQIFLNV